MPQPASPLITRSAGADGRRRRVVAPGGRQLMCLLLSSYIQGSFRDPSVGKLVKANLRPRSKDSKGPLDSRRPNLRRGAQALQCVDIYSSRKMNSSVPSVPHANYQLMQTQPAKAHKNKQLIRSIGQFRRRVHAGASPGASLPSAGLGSYRPLRACQIHGAWAAWRADRPIRSNG